MTVEENFYGKCPPKSLLMTGGSYDSFPLPPYMKLRLPLQQIYVTQPFGVNFLDFYKNMGMAGHNGIDFRAKNGFPVYATHSGQVTFAGSDGDGGIQAIIWEPEEHFKTISYHLSDVNVSTGQIVNAGQTIGWSGNTGKYSTGPHLHYGLKMTDEKGSTLNYDNGYFGAINPEPYFSYDYQGNEINNKDWEKSRAYHRYGHEKIWAAEFKIRFKNAWIHKQLINRYKRNPLSLTTEEVNAIVYGAWDFDIVMNGAMREMWAFITKGEYLKGKKQFE